MNYLKRIPVLIAIMAFAVLAACSQTPVPAPEAQPAPGPMFERSDAFVAYEQVGSGNVSEAYLLERIHGNWAHNLGVVMGHLWVNSTVSSISTKTWPDDYKVRISYHCGNETVVTFKNLAYDPELSAIVYGKTTIAQTVPTELGGHSYLYDLSNSSEPGSFNQTDTVTLEQTRSVTLTHSTDFNVTASSETTVGGSFSGIGVEEKITVATGLSFHDEQQKAQSESQSRTESHSFDVALPPFEATLIVLDTSEVQSSTPFAMNAIASWAPEIFVESYCEVSYPSDEFDHWLTTSGCWLTDHGCSGNKDANIDWCAPHGGYNVPGHDPAAFINSAGCALNFESLDRLRQFFLGVHERWPGMGRWGAWLYAVCYKSSSCHAAFNALSSVELRRVQLTGTQHRTYENAIKETVTNVTGQDLDDVISKHSAAECDPATETCGLGGNLTIGFDEPPPNYRDPVLDRIIERSVYLWNGLQAETEETLDFQDAGYLIAAVINKGE